MTSREFRRWLSQQGGSFEPGKGGHVIVGRGLAWAVLPMHGSNQELGKGLVEKIKKQLGLK